MPHEIVCTMAANNMIKGILESLFSYRNTHLLFTPLSTLQRGLFLFLWVINVNLHVDFLASRSKQSSIMIVAQQLLPRVAAALRLQGIALF